MSAKLQIRKSATAVVNPQDQNLDSVHRIVDQILKMAGCGKCGRLAILKIDLLGDPSPELGKAGVISLETQGF